jgi:hypothetical protein
MIDPQRDLHNAQNPGVLVSDSASLVGNFVVPVMDQTFAVHPPQHYAADSN